MLIFSFYKKYLYYIYIYIYLYISVDSKYVLVSPPNIDSMYQSSSSTLRKKGRLIYSWDIEENYSCEILTICRLNTDTCRTVEVKDI